MTRFLSLALLLFLFQGANSSSYHYGLGNNSFPVTFEWIEESDTDLAEIKGTLYFKEGKRAIPVTVGTGNLQWTALKSGEKHIFVSGEKGKFNGKLRPGYYQLSVKAAEGEQLIIDQFYISKGGHYQMRVELGESVFHTESWPPSSTY
jgi:hypothetical protein